MNLWPDPSNPQGGYSQPTPQPTPEKKTWFQ